MLNKHGEDVAVMDLRRVSTMADFFVIGTAVSSPQLSAIVEEVERQFRPLGERVWHVEGLEKPAAGGNDGFQWVLVDCGDVVIHLFTPPARTLYQLERLWGDAPQIPLDPVQLSSS